MKKEKLDLFEFAKFQGFLFAAFGLFLGILYSFGGLIHDALTTGLNEGTALAFMALIGMPVIFLAIGLVIGLVEAILYNLAIWRLINITDLLEKND